MNAYNDFGKAEKVNIQSFSGYKFSDNILKVTMPSKSVVTFEIE